ncbi:MULTISPECIES: hypothetical protein [unclassified Arthrobacter]|uniref:hypothetical protein n=1 Tax=unclassified Arthrobacter TaxID=235627 RepID=UPI002E0B008A|nr:MULTISPECIES: hypothetical protein [unclassified Arthrobacter]MEC5192247.1 hypothetical protein [Arthrobacter sp. MP_M4]MEC5203711.1 hypothetical protein [Arthrobacter sp. MP_M7]
MILRTITPAALLLSTALALAGCGGTPAPSAPGGPSSAAAPASPTTPDPSSPAAGPSSAPSPAATVKAYAAGDLAQIIAGLTDERGAGFTAVSADQLEQGIATAKKLIATAAITPPECAAVVDSNSQIPEGSSYASGVSQSAADQVVTVVTVVAVQDPDLQRSKLDESVAGSKKCASFTMELQGQKVASETKVLDIATSAEKSFSTMGIQTLPTGQTQTTVTVMGLSGALTAAAVASGPGVTEDAAADLARIVDEALAKG